MAFRDGADFGINPENAGNVVFYRNEVLDAPVFHGRLGRRVSVGLEAYDRGAAGFASLEGRGVRIVLEGRADREIGVDHTGRSFLRPVGSHSHGAATGECRRARENGDSRKHSCFFHKFLLFLKNFWDA